MRILVSAVKYDMVDRRCIVTGASSGIGEATAVACAKAGMPVVLGARREDRLAAVAGAIRASGGRAGARTERGAARFG